MIDRVAVLFLAGSALFGAVLLGELNTDDPSVQPAGAPAPTFNANGTNAAQNTTATFYAAGSYSFLAKITDWYQAYHAWKGDRHLEFWREHEKYGNSCFPITPSYRCFYEVPD